MKFNRYSGCLIAIAFFTVIIVFGVFFSVFTSKLHTLDTKWSILLLLLILFVSFLYDQKAKKNNKINLKEYKEIGELLFPNYVNEFNDFYGLYASNKKDFLKKYDDILKDHQNLDLKKLTPIEVLYIFGNSRNLFFLTDWEGEENEGEIEANFEKFLNSKPIWLNVSQLRNSPENEKLSSEKFILKLFNSFDKDLKIINKKLIFLNLNWDVYIYTCINSQFYIRVKNKSKNALHGIDKFFRKP